MIDIATQRELWKRVRRYAHAFGEQMAAAPTHADPGWKPKGRAFDEANAALASFIQHITITDKRAP